MSRWKIWSSAITFLGVVALGLGMVYFCKQCKSRSSKYKETFIYGGVRW